MRRAAEPSPSPVKVEIVKTERGYQLLRGGERRIGNDPNCTPGYYNNEGQLASAAAAAATSFWAWPR